MAPRRAVLRCRWAIPVESAAHNSLAESFTVLDTVALAAVLRHELRVAHVVADAHANTTATAHHQTLEQPAPRAVDRVADRCLRPGIVAQTANILLVLGPGDVARGAGYPWRCASGDTSSVPSRAGCGPDCTRPTVPASCPYARMAECSA
jgi:hypothetical protein